MLKTINLQLIKAIKDINHITSNINTTLNINDVVEEEYLEMTATGHSIEFSLTLEELERRRAHYQEMSERKLTSVVLVEEEFIF